MSETSADGPKFMRSVTGLLELTDYVGRVRSSRRGQFTLIIINDNPIFSVFPFLGTDESNTDLVVVNPDPDDVSPVSCYKQLIYLLSTRDTLS